MVVVFLYSVAGLAFLHRWVLALHLVYTEVGACGIRLVCLFLRITTLCICSATSAGRLNPYWLDAPDTDYQEGTLLVGIKIQ